MSLVPYAPNWVHEDDYVEVVVHNVPPSVYHRRLRKVIGRSLYHIQREPVIPFLVKVDRRDFPHNQSQARVVFGRSKNLARWLQRYSGRHTQTPIMIDGNRLGFMRTNDFVDKFQRRAILHADPAEVDSDYDDQGDEETIAQPLLNLRRVDCGAFDELDRFCTGWSRQAKTANSHVSFDIDETRLRIRIEDEVIDGLLIDLAHVYVNRKESRIYFVFKNTPRFLRSESNARMKGDGEVQDWFNSQVCEYGRADERFVRLSAFDDAHRRCASYATVYRVEVPDPNKVPSFFERSRSRLCYKGHIDEKIDEVEGCFDRKKMMGVLEKLGYRLAFQAESLVGPHKLMPKNIVDLQTVLRDLEKRLGTNEAAECVRNLRHETLDRGPHVRERGKKPTSMRKLAKILTDVEADKVAIGNASESLLNKRNGYFSIHTVNLTPSMSIRLEGPHIDEGNRILRQYRGYEDFFLRVRITEEDASAFHVMKDARRVNSETLFHEVYGDVFKRAGITVAGRRFYFLAYGNSGLRENICWFVRKFPYGDKKVTAQMIRDSVGDLGGIRNPARYAARLGQAFSASSIVIDMKREDISREKDVVTDDHKYEFTEGIGRCSPAVLARVNEFVRGRNSNDLPPLSAFQIRLEGAKGMLAVDTRLTGEQVILRDSMVKFQTGRSDDRVLLEVSNYWLRPLPVFLNRPFITLLETLGIPVSVFVDLQQKAVDELEKASLDPFMATTLHKHNNLGRAANIQTLIKQLEARGINAVTDIPFLHDVNISFINFALRRIKYAARIPIDKSYTLVGVVDETGILRPNQVVACIAHPDKEPVYLKGACLVGRSPLLAPGDIQRAVAVEPPRGHPLRALHNVIVFSRQGARPLPSMLSGGDLDGDLYNVIQQPDLLKIDWTAKAANYSRPVLPDLRRPCTVDDVVDFYLDYMKLDKVGLTANLHLQIADRSEFGSADEDCVKLAELHSIAVDFAKTGIAPNMRSGPRTPAEKPDFMQKEYRLEELRGNTARCKKHPRQHERFYRSQKALGEMFRMIDVYASTSKWSQASRSYVDEDESGESRLSWSQMLWRHLQKEDRHHGWQEEVERTQEDVKMYYRVLDVIAQDHCPEDKMEKLSEEEVFMGHVMCRGPHGTRISAFDISTRLQADFEELCLRTRYRVLVDRRFAVEERDVYEPLCQWMVAQMNTDVTTDQVRDQLKTLSKRLGTQSQVIAARWEKHLRFAVKRGVAFVRAAFDYTEARSAAWIVIPSVFVAHHLLDCLQLMEPLAN